MKEKWKKNKQYCVLCTKVEVKLFFRAGSYLGTCELPGYWLGPFVYSKPLIFCSHIHGFLDWSMYSMEHINFTNKAKDLPQLEDKCYLLRYVFPLFPWTSSLGCHPSLLDCRSLWNDQPVFAHVCEVLLHWTRVQFYCSRCTDGQV